MQKLLSTVLCPVMLVQMVRMVSLGIAINESMNSNAMSFLPYVSI